ncbi:hypothetical protein [Pseudomonas sp. YuFO8]|uniref:hypothetical protein n=1 Tax=Pseudomonas sp. YuFO8 TaxID=3095361 RepID=UPI002B24AAB8|nr:hypothetical protein [Pseudomonas sp. YuFO8]MEB2621448.1 hypothetical protein [Pseudomonas sp. YuFO8]
MKEDLLVPAIVALVVGLIAAVVSLVVSILAKDQKTSEFRQAWIDALRNDVSQLIAQLGIKMTTTEIIQSKSTEQVDEYLLAHQEDYVEIAMLISRIRLRLNPDEHEKLIHLLISMDNFNDKGMGTRIETISVEAQQILKTEWDRVKVGEPSFVWLKRISKAGFFSVLAIGVGVCAAVVSDQIGTYWSR